MWRFISQSSREEDDRLIQNNKEKEIHIKMWKPETKSCRNLRATKGERNHKMERKEMVECEKHATTKDRPKPWIPLEISDSVAVWV